MPENQSKPATVQSAQSEERPQILVITGISGAGRSTVANAYGGGACGDADFGVAGSG